MPPRRASSLPRLSGLSSETPISTSSLSALTPQPHEVIVTAQASQAAALSIPQPTVPADEPSDAETLALPGMPGTSVREGVPNPIAEDGRERKITDPYEAAPEDPPVEESASAENIPTSDGASSAQSHDTPRSDCHVFDATIHNSKCACWADSNARTFLQVVRALRRLRCP